MSNLALIVPERAADIGGFLVGRLLPCRQRRAVGPFVFIDHMEPAEMGPGENLDVLPHPHIGLSTLTYLFEGAVRSDGNTYAPKQLLVARDSKLCSFEMEAGSTVYVFGGEAFPEARYIDWNLLPSSKERLAEAREDWINQCFTLPPGESDYVPYPGRG